MEVLELLQDLGAELLRMRNHQVWRLPNSRRFVVPKTTASARSWKNAMSDLRRLASQ